MGAPYWLDDGSQSVSASTAADRVDVAIVGAGITGCSCALTLASAGLRVRVHDAREVAGGASGRNGGFALRGGAARYDVARESYGEDEAAELWRWTERCLDGLAASGGDSFRRTGSLRLAADAEEREGIRAEYEALREDGFAVEWRDDLTGRLAGRFHGAMFHPTDGSLQPARFVRRLAKAGADRGVEFRTGHRVESIDDLAAERIVLATDGYGRGLVPGLDDAVWPARGQVIASAPLEERLFEYPHYARQGFDYWQQLDDGRIVLGGFRDHSILAELTDQELTTEVIQDALEGFLTELVERPVEITHRWCGIFGLTQDLLPLVGRVPGRDDVWVSVGYSGHGNVLGFGCGDLVARTILGEENPLLGVFDPARLLEPAAG
jgi:gamma-glutamylputrescine oxidase